MLPLVIRVLAVLVIIGGFILSLVLSVLGVFGILDNITPMNWWIPFVISIIVSILMFKKAKTIKRKELEKDIERVHYWAKVAENKQKS